MITLMVCISKKKEINELKWNLTTVIWDKRSSQHLNNGK